MKVTSVPGVTGVPVLSVRVAVMVEELLPSAGIVAGSAARVMETGAPPKPTYMLCVTPCDVAVTSADPGVVPAIRETDTIPVSSAVVTLVLDKVPRVVEKVTVVPAGTGFPLASLTVAVIALELEPSAGMLVGEADRVMDPTPGLIRIIVVMPDTKLEAMAWILTVPGVVEAV